MNQTIAAIATASGNGGIGVIRISGPDADRVLAKACRIAPDRCVPRKMLRVQVYDPSDGSVVDDGLAVRFPGPNSYTGEDSVELHLHGGRISLASSLDAVLRCGANHAQAGEFTERAFRNGKMDLARAEAVAAYIAAGSQSALRVAKRQLDGGLSRAIENAGDPVRAVLAAVEAAIDYPEEIGAPDAAVLDAGLIDAEERVRRLLDGALRGMRLEHGATVVLVGRPNVGKSSLLNRIAGREHAIVTDIPGTTRDPIDVDLCIGGIPVRLVDTAGLRETEDTVEAIGVRRSHARAETADMVLVILDATDPIWPEGLPIADPRTRVVLNKIDRIDANLRLFDPAWIRSSAITVGGADAVVAALEEGLAGADGDDTVLVTKARHVDALRRANTAIGRAREGIAGGVPLECVAVDAHDALAALSEILGGDGRDETIREIFSRFCLGK